MSVIDANFAHPHVGTRRDARPIRATDDNTLWHQAIEARDAIATRIRATLASEGVAALVLTSQNGIYPPWARLEAWLPDSDAGETYCQRAELNFVVDASPYRRTEIVTTAKLKRGRRSIEVARRPEFNERHVAEWTRYALDRGPVPDNYTPRRDTFLSLIGMLVPPLRPHRNPVAKAFRTSVWRSIGVGFAGIFVLLIINGVLGPDYPIVSFLAVAGIAALGIWTTLARRKRQQIISVTPQPRDEPRNLGLVDSWHVLVTGLGRDHETLRRKLMARFSEASKIGINTRSEVQGYRTPNGYEERERLALTKGQSVVHALIHPYGDDLFVGWHANLNWAQWSEYLTGLSKLYGSRQIEFHELRPSLYQPNLFDLMDLNGLSDFVHRQFEQELKSLLTERAIDQEIDFEIVRGDRSAALSKERHAAKDDSKPGSGRWAGIMNQARAWEQTSITEKYLSAETTSSEKAKEKSAERGQRRTALPAMLVLPLVGVGLGYAITTLGLASAAQGLVSPLGIAIMLGLVLYGGVSVVTAIVAYGVTAILLQVVFFGINGLIPNSYEWLGIASSVISPAAWLTAAGVISPVFNRPLLWIVFIGLYGMVAALPFYMFRNDLAYYDYYQFYQLAALVGPAIALAMLGRLLDKTPR